MFEWTVEVSWLERLKGREIIHAYNVFILALHACDDIPVLSKAEGRIAQRVGPKDAKPDESVSKEKRNRVLDNGHGFSSFPPKA